MDFEQNNDRPRTIREMEKRDYRTINRTFSDIGRSNISLLKKEVRKKTAEISDLTERIHKEKGWLKQLDDELDVAARRDSIPTYEEDFTMPDWEDVVSAYPQIKRVSHHLEDYSHPDLQSAFKGMCCRWQGITEPILIDEYGSLLDGRLRLMVEHKYPEESLGEVPFEVVKGEPWEIVYLKNGGRIRSLSAIGVVEHGSSNKEDANLECS